MDINPPETDPVEKESTLAYVSMDAAFIYMSVGNSMQLHLRGTSVNETDINLDFSRTRWVSSNLEAVAVDSNGKLMVFKTTSTPIMIYAEVIHNGVTKRDTSHVYVTQEQLDVDAIRVISLDSNYLGKTGFFTHRPKFRVDLLKGGISVREGVQVTLRLPRCLSSSYFVSGIYELAVVGNCLGSRWVKVSGYVNGKHLVDSALYNLTYPAEATVQISTDAVSGEILYNSYGMPLQLSKCATIAFLNQSGTPLDIAWEDSLYTSDCSPANAFFLPYVIGNIYELGTGFVTVKFSNTGTKIWRARRSDNKIALPRAAGAFEIIENTY